MCAYYGLLEPEASDVVRLEACGAILACVTWRLHIEEFQGLGKYKRERPVDPYGQVWRTTRSGAELWMVAHLLEIAIKGLEEGLPISSRNRDRPWAVPVSHVLQSAA